MLIHQGKNVTLQFPLFNFQTAGEGAYLQSTHRLPSHLRPASGKSFTCFNNDAYLQYIDYNKPYPKPISSFDVNVNKGGRLNISHQHSAIAAGGYTFNSQTIQYSTKKSNRIPDDQLTSFQQVYTLQIFDYQHFPFPNLKFEIIAEVHTQGDLVIIDIPSITFKTKKARSPTNLNKSPLILGGYVGTFSGSLPKKLRPTQLQTVFDNSSGLNLTIDTYGNLGIASPENITGVIPGGSYKTSPVTITYHRPKSKDFKIKNFIVQPAFTNITHFTKGLENGISDSHVNDFYQDTLAWSWADNSAQTDPSNNCIDCYVAIGKVGKDGKVTVANPIHMSHLSPPYAVWDTAIAINRVNPENIVVSFGLNDYASKGPSIVMVCVSNDGGLTWSIPMNINPAEKNYGDARGVIADRYGNFWFSYSTLTKNGNVSNLVFGTSTLSSINCYIF